MIFRNPCSIPDLYQSYLTLEPISRMYPGFSSWYWDKVVPGILMGEDKIIMAETSKGDLVGVSVIKKSIAEHKLRSVRLTERFQNKGFGLYLIDESLKQLGVDKPIASVAEEMINDYSRILVNRYGFDLTHVYNGLYRKGVLEYEFNGFKNLDKASIIY